MAGLIDPILNKPEVIRGGPEVFQLLPERIRQRALGVTATREPSNDVAPSPYLDVDPVNVDTATPASIMQETTSVIPERIRIKRESNPRRRNLNRHLRLRQLTEGNSLTPYSDAGGIALGQGLNLTVQDPKSLRKMIGNDESLYNKLVPYVGKSYSDLGPEDKKNITLSQREAKVLNTLTTEYALDSVKGYGSNMSDVGEAVLADLHHWAGPTGLRSDSSSKLSVNVDGTKYNPVAAILGGGSDKDLKEALIVIRNNTKKDFVKNRVNKLIKELSN